MIMHVHSVVSIVIGIPTIKRVQESYLSKTLQSLIDSLNEDERLDVLLVVLVAEVFLRLK